MTSWLPRAFVKHATHELQFDILPERSQQPTVGRVEDCTTLIDRHTKWGNAFLINMGREECIRQYAKHIWEDHGLLWDLEEIYGELLGFDLSKMVVGIKFYSVNYNLRKLEDLVLDLQIKKR